MLRISLVTISRIKSLSAKSEQTVSRSLSLPPSQLPLTLSEQDSNILPIRSSITTGQIERRCTRPRDVGAMYERRFLERDSNGHRRALAKRRGELDGSAHEFDELEVRRGQRGVDRGGGHEAAYVFGDDKSETSSAVLSSSARIGLSERLEESRKDVLLDADSGVLDLEQNEDLILGLSLLPNAEGDGA